MNVYYFNNYKTTLHLIAKSKFFLSSIQSLKFLRLIASNFLIKNLLMAISLSNIS